MKGRSKGASPECGFLSFRPVEFLEQSSYSSLELRLNVEPLLHHALDWIIVNSRQNGNPLYEAYDHVNRRGTWVLCRVQTAG